MAKMNQTLVRSKIIEISDEKYFSLLVDAQKQSRCHLTKFHPENRCSALQPFNEH